MRHAVQMARRHSPSVVPEMQIRGEVAERFKAPVLKTGAAAMLPWVRIPPSPPSTLRVGDCVSGQREFARKCGVFGDEHRSVWRGIPLISLTNRPASLAPSRDGRLSYLSVP
jgi:hypothetical protein